LDFGGRLFITNVKGTFTRTWEEGEREDAGREGDREREKFIDNQIDQIDD
jgi:hypothetical protein